MTAVRRVLDDGEQVQGRGRVWAAVRRRHVALLFQRRRQYDAVVTDRRLIVVARRRGPLDPSDVVLVKRFESIVLLEEHRRPTLLQQEIRAETESTFVIEWPYRTRALGEYLSDALHRPVHWQAA